jgi:hypothetical protein
MLGYSPDIPENSNILKKEIPEEQSDVTLWRWEGNYDNGKMVSIDIGYPVEEIELERQLFEYIGKEYPINVLTAVLFPTKSNHNLLLSGPCL